MEIMSTKHDHFNPCAIVNTKVQRKPDKSKVKKSTRVFDFGTKIIRTDSK